MTAALLDAAASAPQTRPSRPAGSAATEAARVRRRLGRWLEQLAGLAVGVLERMSAVVARRRRQGAVRGTAMGPGVGRVDLNLPFDLLARAMRWSRALGVRLKAEAEAAKAAMKLQNQWRERPEPAERLEDSDDDFGWIDRTLRRVRNGPPAAALAPDDCIDGKPTAEVVGQICVDLGVAASMLCCYAALEQIVAIAEAGRALLAGPDEAWTPLPAPGTSDVPVGDVAPVGAVAPVGEVAPGAMQPAATPLAAPAADTG
jgi:hypothetical protein